MSRSHCPRTHPFPLILSRQIIFYLPGLSRQIAFPKKEDPEKEEDAVAPGEEPVASKSLTFATLEFNEDILLGEEEAAVYFEINSFSLVGLYFP